MSKKPISPPDEQGTSTRPYLIRALHEWCSDNGFTPYLAVYVGAGVQVPMEYVKDHEIVLNVGFDATSGLKLGNEFVEFKARFGGVSREILVPVDHVVAIYARENGQGMAFPAPLGQGVRHPGADLPLLTDPARGGLRLAPMPGGDESVQVGHRPADEAPPEPPLPTGGGRPSLKRIK